MVTNKVTKEKRRRLHLAFDIFDIVIAVFSTFAINLLIFSQQPDVLSMLGKIMTAVIVTVLLVLIDTVNIYRAFEKDGFIHHQNKS